MFINTFCVHVGCTADSVARWRWWPVNTQLPCQHIVLSTHCDLLLSSVPYSDL